MASASRRSAVLNLILSGSLAEGFLFWAGAGNRGVIEIPATEPSTRNLDFSGKPVALAVDKVFCVEAYTIPGGRAFLLKAPEAF